MNQETHLRRKSLKVMNVYCSYRKLSTARISHTNTVMFPFVYYYSFNFVGSQFPVTAILLNLQLHRNRAIYNRTMKNGTKKLDCRKSIAWTNISKKINYTLIYTNYIKNVSKNIAKLQVFFVLTTLYNLVD